MDDIVTFRAFISIDIDEMPKITEFCNDLASRSGSLKVVRPELIHVTLRFFGDIEERVVPDIRRIMTESVIGIKPFDVDFHGAGSFPGRSKIRVVWVGIKNHKEISIINERLEAGLESIGFRKENRAFSPHLTVARSRNDLPGVGVVQAIDKYRDVDFGSQRIDSIRLKKSVLGPSGPAYSTVDEIFLEKESA